jgi:hypothetical protein
LIEAVGDEAVVAIENDGVGVGGGTEEEIADGEGGEGATDGEGGRAAPPPKLKRMSTWRVLLLRLTSERLSMSKKSGSPMTSDWF